ncbi:MAG TPA: nickel-responsive transcriptional regulator NikR [Phycisphaerae bacterium]|nr:nickel-responsive transcriptional regulator NikR [Phycisphaerae bacterium]HPS53589.1 nickel-responsive transcriptional regulator NikR [Phycisphaerae bacterium]
MSELVRFSVSIERPLFDKFEKLVRKAEYENRSEYIRDLIRESIIEQNWQSRKQQLGTITITYNHHTRGLVERLLDIQHHFSGKVLANTHVHLEEHICAEMIMVRGTGKEIQSLANHLRREKGVLHAQLAVGCGEEAFE